MMKQNTTKLPYERPTMNVYMLKNSNRLLQPSNIPLNPNNTTPNQF